MDFNSMLIREPMMFNAQRRKRSKLFSKVKPSEREDFISAEKYYKTEISKGSIESLYLLMLLYGAAGEKTTLQNLWDWTRDTGIKDNFLKYVAYYLTMLVLGRSPLRKDVISYLMPYYEKSKPYFPEAIKYATNENPDEDYVEKFFFYSLDQIFHPERPQRKYTSLYIN